MTKALYHSSAVLGKPLTVWDLAALLLVLTALFALGWGATEMATPYSLGDPIHITLSPLELPAYAIRTITRMLIAMVCSLLFTFVFATWAAKSREAERIIIPFIDIMQSVPVLGVLSIIVVGCIKLFPGSLLGPELAAIIAIFTAQVWNMALSFYQSLKTVPNELHELGDMLHLSPMQRFWRVEVPFAFPSLIWNIMISMSASWFFVVASEAISVNNQNISLPGIGSYIALAIDEANVLACVYAILAMLFVILIYDQLLFRPMISWSARFRAEEDDTESQSWFLNILQRARIIRKLAAVTRRFFLNLIPLFSRFSMPALSINQKFSAKYSHTAIMLWRTFYYGFLAYWAIYAARYVMESLNYAEVAHVLWLASITFIKVLILILLCSVIWVPIGVKIGLSPRARKWAQPACQFLAAFPANLFFPLFVIAILKFHLSVNVFTSPLMILGTQWYILFNVIAGARQIPHELLLACDNFGVTSWLRWKKFLLPAIFPYYVTGALTAAGGCWNASIIADIVQWGDVKLTAVGLGGYIAEYTATGDFPRIALGIGVMCLFVNLLTHFVWAPLYKMAGTRFKLDDVND